MSGSGVLLSGNGVLLSDIFKNIYCWSSYVFGVLLSLGFYCRVNIHFFLIFKKLGFYCRWSSSVFGVLLSLEFHCQHPVQMSFLANKKYYNSFTKLLYTKKSRMNFPSNGVTCFLFTFLQNTLILV